MKTAQKNIGNIAVLFLAILLLQGCVVYHNTSVGMEEAVSAATRVKIKAADDKKVKLKKVVLEDGQYYGIKNNRGELVRIPLDEKRISSVHLKNKTLSTIINIGVPAVIIGLLFVPVSFLSVPLSVPYGI
jgi:uncharacterized protein YpmB